MRRVEVVSLLEYLELEVWEDTAEPGCDRPKLVGVAQPAKRVVDRAVKACQRIVVELVCLEGPHEGSDPARTFCHPRRRVSGRWWGKLYTRLDVEPHERAHELVRRERFKPVVLAPERLLRRAEIPATSPGRLQEGEACQPLRVAGRERQRCSTP